MIDVGVILLDAASNPLIDLAMPTYEVVEWTRPDRNWRRQTVSSPFVDGDLETGAVLDSGLLVVTVRIKRTTWALVDSTYRTLVTTAEENAQYIACRLEGVTETYRRRGMPSSTYQSTHAEVAGRQRTVTLSFPVSVVPAITGA